MKQSTQPRRKQAWLGFLILAAGLFMTQLVQAAPLQQTPTPPPQQYLPLILNQPTPTVTFTPVPGGPPADSVSHYLSTVNTTTLYNLGCSYGTKDAQTPGTQDWLMFLYFGRPRIENGILGTKIYGGGLVTMQQIAEAVQAFGKGYYFCTGADLLSHVTIGIGTSNYAFEDCDNCAVTYDHGRAWAQMVNGVNTWLVNSRYSGQVSAVGASDIELSWNYPTDTIAWMNGYDSANNFELLNFGALPGCPRFSAPGATCGSYPYIWSYEQVWFAIWGSPPVYPVPEIYANSGVNAEQWYLMSVYAYDHHGQAVEFRGVMTQWMACQQVSDPTCVYLDNTPEQGWQQLSDLVNSNSKTRHYIRYLTDIRW